MGDRLAPILERKRRENERRRAHLRGLRVRLLDANHADASHASRASLAGDADRREAAVAALRPRSAGAPAVIAEVKFRSPSAGVIRPRTAGEGVRVARAYEEAGAAAVSVLCDRAGFGGSPLELRRIARALDVPVLFKEFVLDPIQLDLARATGASLVLLLVRALSASELLELVRGCHERGLEPVVEAADEVEVDAALRTDARIVGVNARDLSTFEVDPGRAARALARIPSERVRVYMSGVSSAADLRRIGSMGADAALVGTSLMRSARPGEKLARLLGGGSTSASGG